MNIHLEVGVHHLKYVREFYDTHRDREWQFELFEPNPISIPIIKQQISAWGHSSVCLHEVAAWSSSCERVFHVPSTGLWRQAGASLFSGKRSCDKQLEGVVCINFGQWIMNNLDKGDYIHMNMDIEGAEYEVLPSMIKDGSIDYIDALDIEFHYMKFKGETRARFRKIHRELREFFDKFDGEKRLWRL